ncbi:IS66 Orf2 family protein (plasmid) [Burkholderia sp. YI23]|nr:IS66 Orf2 family protein [Burkholderia sp. YI23]
MASRGWPRKCRRRSKRIRWAATYSSSAAAVAISLWATDDGLWLLAKRLERGRFIWPQADGGKIHLSSAQLSMLLEGIDWRHPQRTAALSML